MTQYSYPELREALDKASIVCKSISINGNSATHWYYNELDELQAIINALPEKPTAEQEEYKARSNAWSKVIEHPFFYSERWGSKPILEAVLEKLDELHRGPLPTETGTLIRNARVADPFNSTKTHSKMFLSNIGWVALTEEGVLEQVSEEHIKSWEPDNV